MSIRIQTSLDRNIAAKGRSPDKSPTTSVAYSCAIGQNSQMDVKTKNLIPNNQPESSAFTRRRKAKAAEKQIVKANTPSRPDTNGLSVFMCRKISNPPNVRARDPHDQHSLHAIAYRLYNFAPTRQPERYRGLCYQRRYGLGIGGVVRQICRP
jgi:hypothetical protein